MPQLVEDRAESPQNLSGIPRSSLFVSSLVVIALMSGWGIFLYLGIGSLIPTKPKPKPTPIHRNSKSATQISGTENETSASAYRDAERTFVLKLQRDEMQERLEST
ncbi:MAG: hypothetical protein KDA93_13040, partial [Planctomycetaceae bacterium]|nr:hypothetical protein [Planctomycetaceae bacterium]